MGWETYQGCEHAAETETMRLVFERMTEKWYVTGMTIARKKTTIYLDPELLRAAKVLAASTGRHDYEILEDALRLYIMDARSQPDRQALQDVFARLASRGDLDDDDALNVAYAELHEARRAHQSD
jgi:hypothetical protein